MAPRFVLHKITTTSGTTAKDYFFLANPGTYEDAGIAGACGARKATDAEKKVEIPHSVGALIGSSRVLGVTIYGKSGSGLTAKRHTHKVLCAADKLDDLALKTGTTYRFVKGDGSALPIEITKVMVSRKADFFKR